MIAVYFEVFFPR